MAVSRWERGAQEPLSHSYIELGNLAGASDCWHFWGRAGLRTEDVLRVMPETQRQLRGRMSDFTIIGDGGAEEEN